MRPDDLLTRIAEVVRADVAPAVGDEYLRTQAYMAAVILGKLAGQLRAAQVATHGAGEAELLAADVGLLLGGAVPQAVVAALRDADLSGLVAALWAARDELGEQRFAAALARVRRTLRARLDAELEYSA